MAMTRAQFRRCVQDIINTMVGMNYRMRQPEWGQIFDVKSSTKAEEKDMMMVGLGAAPIRTEGAPYEFDEGAEAWIAVYTHVEVAMGFTITKMAQEDNMYGSLATSYGQALGRSMRETQEILHCAILNNAYDPAYPIGDGASLLADNHPLYHGGTASNKLATPADFSETSLEALLTQMSGATDDRGLPITVNARRLIVPRSLQFEAARVLSSSYRPGTQLNDINAIKALGMLQTDPVQMTRLVDQDGWFVQTDIPQGLKHYRRIALQRKSNIDNLTDNLQYMARERYTAGVTDWRAMYGSEGV